VSVERAEDEGDEESDLRASAELAAWLDRIERLHPRNIDLGLERVQRVAGAMGLGRPAPTVVTVGGTNGKGSCVTFLETILSTAGLATAAYLSPHLQRYNERLRIGGVEVDDAALVEGFEAVEAARGDVSLTYFEFGTLAALWLMQRAQLDVAVLEVGLGGRLDAVNAVDADVAILTSIDIDHEEWLGGDRDSIGREKSGIFRSGRPAICGDPSPPPSVLTAAQACGAKLIQLGRHFAYVRKGKGWNWQGLTKRYAALPLPTLAGAFQLRNASCALAAIEQLSRRHVIAEGDVRAGLLTASLPGRFQRIADEVAEWVYDVGHNAEAAGALAAELAAAPVRGRTIAVIGMMRDKRVEEYARRLAGCVHTWLAATLPPPRGLEDRELAERIESALGVDVQRAGGVEAACARAAELAGPRDRILVCGSFYSVGPALVARGVSSRSGGKRSGVARR
jgi:dihydrofolate synthase/folylpolyglutamate synthase